MFPRIRKVLSLFLGALMFMFGFLKFFQPIHGWFDVQIQESHLPHQAILLGKFSEMATGALFLLPWLRRSLKDRQKDQLLLIACASLIIEMGVAIYVHLQPQVPPAVLPLGIKPPVIPLFVLFLGFVTAIAAWKERRAKSPRDNESDRRSSNYAGYR